MQLSQRLKQHLLLVILDCRAETKKSDGKAENAEREKEKEKKPGVEKTK